MIFTHGFDPPVCAFRQVERQFCLDLVQAARLLMAPVVNLSSTHTFPSHLPQSEILKSGGLE